MKKLISTLLIALSLQACSACENLQDCDLDWSEFYRPRANITLNLPLNVNCPDCSEKQMEIVKDGMAIWNDALQDTYFEYDEDRPTRIQVSIVAELPAPNQVFDRFKPDEGAIAFKDYDASRDLFLIYLKYGEGMSANNMAHELGHVLGFEHARCKCSINYYQNNACRHVTKEIISILRNKKAENN